VRARGSGPRNLEGLSEEVWFDAAELPNPQGQLGYRLGAASLGFLFRALDER
jgi:hypothetical protein